MNGECCFENLQKYSCRKNEELVVGNCANSSDLWETDFKSMFHYVHIPADASRAIEQRSASKEGGLIDDALRRGAEEYFEGNPAEIDIDTEKRATADALVQQGMETSKINEIMETVGGKRIGSNVEIITVSVANDLNKFVGVSMYTDGHISFKPKALFNRRASKLLRNCGHDTDVKGDAFIGRAFDDEREEWVRLDFLSDDLDDGSPWISATKAANAGRNMGAYRTSGAMKKIIQPGQDAEVSVEEKLLNDTAAAASSGYLSWNQTTDEVEVRFALSPEQTAKILSVTILTNALRISLKSGDKLSTIGEKFQSSEGGLLFGRVKIDDSMWSVSTEDNIKVLCVTLAKADSTNWKSLLQ